MKFSIKDILYAAICVGSLGFLSWANATGYVLFGAATKYAPNHSNPLYHK